MGKKSSMPLDLQRFLRKEKTDKLNFIKMKSFLWKTTDWGKYSQLRKNSYNSIIRRQTTQTKKRQMIWTGASQNKIYKWPISNWKMPNVIIHQGYKWKLQWRTYTLLRMATSRSDNTKHWQKCGTTANLAHCWRKRKMEQPLQKSLILHIITIPTQKFYS